MEGKGEAGEGAWESRLLGEGRRERGRDRGRRGLSRQLALGSDLGRPPAVPCLGRGWEPHCGFPGMPGCFGFAGLTLLLKETLLLPLPLACEARLGVTCSTGDHHLLPSSTALPSSPSLLQVSR